MYRPAVLNSTPYGIVKKHEKKTTKNNQNKKTLRNSCTYRRRYSELVDRVTISEFSDYGSTKNAFGFKSSRTITINTLLFIIKLHLIRQIEG